jgi:UDP-N-acetylglucosamine 2-epimerase (non-hydrolysing)
MMLKVLSVFGTRPEAIKLAPVIRELGRRTNRIVSKVCVTAQHRQMLDQVLDLFGIVPDHDLDLMTEDQTPCQVASAALSRLEPILKNERPDWVLVQGDTTTVAAASLAAYYSRIPVGHVEAGLRTHNKWSPFPEELNRRVASVAADLHFAPTERARQTLLREGVLGDRILVTGNPVIDALHWAAVQPLDLATLPLDRSCWEDPDLKILLVTAHRRESFGTPLENICRAIRDLALRGNGNIQIIYPVHWNPNVQEPAHRLLKNIPNITLLPPVDYLTLVHLMKRSYLILTDSGGIQEEALGLGVPVLVLREVTERPEAVEAGAALVVGTKPDQIVRETMRLLHNPDQRAQMAKAVNPFGDGQAARRIVEALLA